MSFENSNYFYSRRTHSVTHLFVEPQFELSRFDARCAVIQVTPG